MNPIQNPSTREQLAPLLEEYNALNPKFRDTYSRLQEDIRCTLGAISGENRKELAKLILPQLREFKEREFPKMEVIRAKIGLILAKSKKHPEITNFITAQEITLISHYLDINETRLRQLVDSTPAVHPKIEAWLSRFSEIEKRLIEVIENMKKPLSREVFVEAEALKPIVDKLETEIDSFIIKNFVKGSALESIKRPKVLLTCFKPRYIQYVKSALDSLKDPSS